MKFDPTRPDLPFPGLGLQDISALCRQLGSLAETDRHTFLTVARQAEAWQRRSGRLALAGAEVSKALADVVSAVGTAGYAQACHQVGWVVGDYILCAAGLDPVPR